MVRIHAYLYTLACPCQPCLGQKWLSRFLRTQYPGYTRTLTLQPPVIHFDSLTRQTYMSSIKLAEVGSLNTAVNKSEVSWWAFHGNDSDDLRHSLRIAVWVRWFVGIAWFAQLNYRADFSHHAYIPNTLLALSLLALNGYVHYRIRANRTITWHWALALSALDVATITAGLVIASGFRNEFYVLYYPALAAFAVVFASFRLSFAWVTVTAVLYAALSLTLYTGVDFENKLEKVLFIRIVTMYAVVAAVNLIFRLERIRRREAIERERELQRERIELSQTIHDTIAQSAYMIGIGVETAIELADDQLKAGHVKPSHALGGVSAGDELIAKLRATHALSKSTMWELRHPIDAGPIFEGRELSRVLRSHASTFTTITSIPTDIVQNGREPYLSTVTRGLLFSIAHNAMTNAFRHSRADRVTIALDYGDDSLRMTVADDGIGLPDDYADRGHGFRNMRADAERMGGRLEVSANESGRGAAVTCTIPYDTRRGGRRPVN